MSATDSLDQIEARANAATEGPWHTQPLSPHRPADTYDVEATGRGEMVVANLLHGDAEFIAHARTDVPALVAALRAGERVMAEREAEMGDAIMPDVRALIRDIRRAIEEALS